MMLANLAREPDAAVAGGFAVVAAVRAEVAALLLDKRHKDAVALIDRRLPEPQTDDAACLVRAELLHDAQDFPRADALFRDMLARHADARGLRLDFAKRLRKRGLIADAGVVLEPIGVDLAPGSKGLALLEEIASLHALFSRLEGQPLQSGVDVRILAMKHSILHFRHRRLVPRPTGRLGRVALVSGSVGPGGAERQMTRIATRLQAAHFSGTPIGGVVIDAPVEIVVKSHGPEKRNDFFLPDLVSANVRTHQINAMAPVSARRQAIASGELLTLLENLPAQVNYGVARLTPWFRDHRIDVASLWQDGSVLLGAVAALVAGVRDIQLVFRGLPPNVRRDRYRPEYASLFAALAQVPGVTLISNSRSAARHYADWLKLPIERFNILYNGVEALPVRSTGDAAVAWQAFAALTVGATETIGGVFRFEPDKRPLHWLRMAARYLEQRPAARFIIVGDGRQFDAGVALATDIGIRDRILFVGNSPDVGFWYDKMDVCALMSRFEGLPNVLIEAQFHGVPVVSTPAGGAAECFIVGETGHLLADSETPDLDESCAYIRALVADRSNIAERAAAFVARKFAIPTMLDRFVGLAESGQESRIP